MKHIAFYRAYRPQTFADMVGQQHIVQTLRNSLREGRFSHAYLFCGPRGTGKTSAAKILAKAVNCEQGLTLEPCNTCDACVRITSGSVMDVQEIDAASNRGVEEIRDIRDKVKYAPTEVRQKVYIIDEVHMLTTEAFNALLKTLEEPPPHVMFILATTEPHKLPATIISRCQRFDFRRVPLEEQVSRLAHICQEERISIDQEALRYIARLSDGGMRDAVSLLDQATSYAGENIRYADIVDMTGGIASDQFGQMAIAIAERDIGKALSLMEAWIMAGKSADKCLENLIYYYRDLLVCKMMPGALNLSRTTDSDTMMKIAGQYQEKRIFEIMDILNRYMSEMKYAHHPQIVFEVAVMKLCSDVGERTGDAAAAASAVPASVSGDVVAPLLQRVEQLERQLREAVNSGALAGGAGQGNSGGATSAARPSTTTGASANKPTKITAQMKSLAASADPGFTREVQGKWHQILQAVKDQKITVHAWLVDGEPVAANHDGLLVAFKNTIHRDTTEKPANKQLIQQVLHSVLGKSLQLHTLMQKDWKSIEHSSSQSDDMAPEVLELEAEDAPGARNPEWIDKAIELFGEDLVKVNEEG